MRIRISLEAHDDPNEIVPGGRESPIARAAGAPQCDPRRWGTSVTMGGTSAAADDLGPSPPLCTWPTAKLHDVDVFDELLVPEPDTTRIMDRANGGLNASATKGPFEG